MLVIPFKDWLLREVVVKWQKNFDKGIIVKLHEPLITVVLDRGNKYDVRIVPRSCIEEVGEKIPNTLEELLTSPQSHFRKIGLELYKQLNAESTQ